MSVKILQCPGCKEYIASDATTCRFCKRPLDAQTVQQAVAAQVKENKSYRKGQYLKHLLIGALMFIVGMVITFGTLYSATTSREGGHYVITYGLIGAGALDFLYGLWGWFAEITSKD